MAVSRLIFNQKGANMAIGYGSVINYAGLLKGETLGYIAPTSKST